mgnify:CR=1 FL=1
MPAKSAAQQKAAGAALSAKRGDSKVSDLQGASKGMYESMSESELEELAETDRARAETSLTAMCERLLANMVIENYRIEKLETA